MRLAEPIVAQLARQVTTAYPPSPNRLLQITELLPDSLTGLRAVLQDFPDAPSREVIAPFSVPYVRGLESTAQHSEFPPLHSLIGYFVLDARGLGSPRTETLLNRLALIPAEVEMAYWETEVENAAPPINPGNETIYPASYQGHFSGSSVGINAVAPTVWGQYDGQGVGFGDIESGWNLAHVDLPNPAPAVFNNNLLAGRQHGAAVLGLVVGQYNQRGIVGIAPGATLKKLGSHIRPGLFPGDMDNWAITAAILDALSPGGLVWGDVLLIEVQTLGDAAIRKHPIEVAPEWFDAIRLAAGNGIIVIEPAGNGDSANAGRNLDLWDGHWEGVDTGRTLKVGGRNSDSGAIMVSGCMAAIAPPGAHQRVSWQNFGERVNCYAWGESVYTAGYGPLKEGPNPTINDAYTDDFDGTSAASAIIAGAALLVQSMYEKVWSRRLSPAQMRHALGNRSTGTKIVHPMGADQIGVMPDLGQIATKLGTYPDVYVRDRVGDTGVVPNTMVFQSPDIILRHTASQYPDQDFGEASPLANQVPMNHPVLANADNYVYVRIRNRSAVDAIGVTADLYWSEASSLVAPVHWNWIGQINAGTIHGGGALHVAGPYQWHPVPNKLPISGHGCLIAVLDHALDPQPPSLAAAVGTQALGWDEFLDYVGANNNVAWRNFTVLAAAASSAGPLPFCIRGSWDEPRRFDLVLIAALPEGSRLVWEAPPKLATLIERSAGKRLPKGEASPNGVRFALSGFEQMRLAEIELEAGADHRCLLHLQIPDGRIKDENYVAIQQSYRRILVGQVTWSFR